MKLAGNDRLRVAAWFYKARDKRNPIEYISHGVSHDWISGAIWESVEQKREIEAWSKRVMSDTWKPRQGRGGVKKAAVKAALRALADSL